MKQKERVIVASHGFSNSPFKVGSLHLSKYMVRGGFQVLLITVPVSLFHFANVLLKRPSSKEIVAKFKGVFRGICKTEHGFFEWVPFTILPFSAGNNKLFRFTVENAILILPFLKKRLHNWVNAKVLIIENPRFIWLTKIVKYEILIYRVTDIYSEMEPVGEAFIEFERKMIEKADYIIATSSVIKSSLTRKYSLKKEISVIENGVELENFLRNSNEEELLPYLNLVKKDKINLVFVGAMDSRFDFEILKLLADSILEVEIFLFGPADSKIIKSLKKDNVHFMGVVEYEKLGGLLKYFDIGLLPFIKSKANDGRSPMKLFEYGICGLPVVARKTQDLAIKSKYYNFIFLFEDLAELIKMIHEAYEKKNAIYSEAVNSSKLNSWELITERLLKTINLK